MRYRLMATYRGAPYEAGIGPADGAVVLFAACPPPEELGFEPATGHWRKELQIQDVQAVWQSRPVGKFRGDRCIVLDDLGDRLHIGYLGHDAYRAEQLGYWQVDRGVFELVAARDEVNDIVEERTDYRHQPGSGPPGGYPALPPMSDPGYARPAAGATGGAAPDYPVPVAMPDYPAGLARLAELGRMVRPDGGVAMPPPAAEPPLPLEAEALRAASAASRRDQPVPAAGLAPQPTQNGGPAVPAGLLPPAAVPPAGPRGVPDLHAAPVPQAVPGPVLPGPAPVPPGTPGPQAAPVPAAEPPRRRRSAGQRMATERIFGELASLAAIPSTSYSVGEEVDGAMCLLPTADGFEVFSCAGGARHEVRVFSDEESACFYLFGVLAADAVRTGGLVPEAGRSPAAPSAANALLGR